METKQLCFRKPALPPYNGLTWFESKGIKHLLVIYTYCNNLNNLIFHYDHKSCKQNLLIVMTSLVYLFFSAAQQPWCIIYRATIFILGEKSAVQFITTSVTRLFHYWTASTEEQPFDSLCAHTAADSSLFRHLTRTHSQLNFLISLFYFFFLLISPLLAEFPWGIPSWCCNKALF